MSRDWAFAKMILEQQITVLVLLHAIYSLPAPLSTF